MDNTYYHSRLNKYRKVSIVNSDLKICEELSLLFKLEGFETSFSTDLPSFEFRTLRDVIDVVVADMDLEPESGLVLLRRLKAKRSGTLVIMTTSSPQVEAVVTAMRLGALDVMTTPFDQEHLLQVVRDGLRRDVHIGPSLEGGERKVELRGFAQLTNREREVLQLITDGNSNKTAARALGISDRTVEVHRARVMSKLGARNAVDLIRIVLTS